MPSLSVYSQTSPAQPNKVLTHVEDIASTLAEVGVRFAHWPAPQVLPVGASTEAVLGAYQAQIKQLIEETGLVVVDVLSFATQKSSLSEWRASFLQERTYAGDHVQLCVAGRGLVAVHIGAQVFEILSAAGDLIALPAGTRHWLDIGERTDFVAVRLFADGDAGLARATGDPVSEGFSRLEACM